MVDYQKWVLPNGLRVIFHQDANTPMAAVSLIYDVGSKDEDASKTGYAHLFEHLMFAGSRNAPDFDDIIQDAGGENNAYTNCDMTHFYDILPAQNLETALFLEADRMHHLMISNKSFETQRKVVVEEFMETCYNQPYGDAWHHILNLAYLEHPYRWPTIGLDPKHIEEAKIEDVTRFYQSHYHPGNAILSIGGNFEAEEIKGLVEKHFAHIPGVHQEERNYPTEPRQKTYRFGEVRANVPNDTFYMSFKMASRASKTYYIQDLISDVLANGSSSRLISNLVKEEQVFNSLDAYVYGSTEPGLFIIEGQPMDGIGLEEAERRVWQELEELKIAPILQSELDKQLNKVRTNLIMSETSLLGKVMSLSYYELIGNIDLINLEDEIYRSIQPIDIFHVATRLFRKENCSVIRYVCER